LLVNKELDSTRAFADVTHKELGRLPTAVAAEAIDVAARSQIVAAAGLVCQRLKVELQLVDVLEKSAEGIWFWRIRAKTAHYFLALRPRDMLILSTDSKPMFQMSFSEVDRFAHANGSGSA
jgi:hypothetical protein